MYFQISLFILAISVVNCWIIRGRIRNTLDGISINPRFKFNDVIEGESALCRTKKAVIPPPEGLEKGDVYNYIYNDGEFGVEADICIDEGQPCQISFPGVTTSCQQKYIHVVRTSPSETSEQYKIPGGCVCTYKTM